MQQPTELKVNIAADAFPVEAGKQGCRGSAVKTFVMKKDSDFHSDVPLALVGSH